MINRTQGKEHNRTVPCASQNNATGYLIDTVTENGYTYNYSYDSLGNITGYSKKYAGNVVENYWNTGDGSMCSL